MENITLNYIDTTQEKQEKTLTFSKELLSQPFNEKSLFVSKVQGQSMQPMIFDNALVVADLSNKILEHEKIYLVNYDNNMWIKQAKYDEKTDSFIFVSINPQYAHLVYKQEDVYLIAKVLLTFTSL